MACNKITNIDRKPCNNIPEAANKLALSARLGHSCGNGWNIGGGLLHTNGCFDLGRPCLIVDLNICWYKLVFNFDLVTFCCRFPVSTKSCFDLSMPYVYWARGEIKMATYSFFVLIQKEKRGMNLSGVVIFFI